MRTTRSSPHLHQHLRQGQGPPNADTDQLAQEQAAQSPPPATLSSYPEPFDTRTFNPINPSPLRRQQQQQQHVSNRIERFATLSLNTHPGGGLVNGHGTHESLTPSPGLSAGPGSVTNLRSHSTLSRPARPCSPATEAAAGNGAIPMAEAGASVGWTVDTITAQLEAGLQDIREHHARLTAYVIESTKPTIDRRVHTGSDLFANMQSPAAAEDNGETMRVKFKQHFKSKRDQREVHYMPTCTKTNTDRVPPYRFHHVEIKKNILTPNTMLTFVPHLKDLESSEETKYNIWLKELEDIDLKSGFKPMNREDKLRCIIQGERAATVSLYLDKWLEAMAIPGCTKPDLIRYMAARKPDGTIVPRQKSDMLPSRSVKNTTRGAGKAARMFVEAFQRVFRDDLPDFKQLNLRRVLMLDESVDNVMDSKPIVKDKAGLDATSLHGIEDEDEMAETNLATYCILGCLICYSHSCDHGEYDNKNMKHTFSMGSYTHLSDTLKARRRGRIDDDVTDKICQRQCYRTGADQERMRSRPRPWSEDERIVLRSLYTTTRYSSYKGDPICLAADFLDRSCDEVFAEFKRMGITLPEPEPWEAPRVKGLSWYDRHRKVLVGDWQEHTISHAHQRRENIEPCSHDGPCAPRACPCVDAGVLCEKYCRCTVEQCAYKFTGCACHSQGQTCQQNRKDKPCICVQLSRECDPQLCDSCGASERADPLNAHDAELHATGCQNCHLQRGVTKSLVLGQSQLEGCGYGLFTAGLIEQDEFVIEYVGELITHDEGVRREARRGDVFDEESNVSYVFTLLENEGIWVDAAIYGNLSRYINHASEHDKRRCNVTPRILYVNGEYRIRFTAMRDIQPGEELFFNYGENFPNLTKKLLDDKAARKPETRAKGTRAARSEASTSPRKATEFESGRRPVRPRAKQDVAGGSGSEVDGRPTLGTRKRKRRLDEGEGPSPVVPRKGAACHVDEAHKETEEPGSGSRPRRTCSRLETLERPTRWPEMSRGGRGKRGGARPGSGRPRKHPRTIGKGTPGGYDFPDESPETFKPPMFAIKAARRGAASRSSSRSLPTPEPKRYMRSAGRTQVLEIEDSYDEADSSALSGSRGRRVAEGAARRSTDEAEDENGTARHPGDRETRVRRLPAKFRDEGLWG